MSLPKEPGRRSGTADEPDGRGRVNKYASKKHGMGGQAASLARHEPVVSGPHFDEGFGCLSVALFVRMEPYRKDPKPSANGPFRMNQMGPKPQAAQGA